MIVELEGPLLHRPRAGYQGLGIMTTVCIV